jgi:hypothetical protein
MTYSGFFESFSLEIGAFDNFMTGDKYILDKTEE